MKTKPNSTHYEECSADEDPDGETMCVCPDIEAQPKPDPRGDEGCQAEFIDGSWYGDDCPDCRQSVESEMDECGQCEDEEYCSKHENGIYG